MSLIKRNGENSPLRTMLTDLFDSNSFFQSDLNNFKTFFSGQLPAANVKETDNQFEIELAIPGFSKNDFKINIDNDVLTISGEKKEEKKADKDNSTRREFNYSSFERSFTLPTIVDENGIKAEYKEGLLQLVVPKKEEARKKAKKEISIQ